MEVADDENQDHLPGWSRFQASWNITPMSTDRSPFDFPVDILRCIVEFAGWNDIRTAQSLELVNRAFRLWAGPAVYRTVLLPSPSELIGFSELVRAAPAPSSPHATGIARDTDFYANSVKYLGIFKPRVLDSVLDPIFRVCSGLITLEAEGVAYYGGAEECTMRPRQFILPTNYMSRFPSSLFANLTHLWSNVLTYPNYVDLPLQLKCLAIPLWIHNPRSAIPFLNMVLALPQLALLVLNLHPSNEFKQGPQPVDVWSGSLSQLIDERIIIRNAFGPHTQSESRLALQTGVSIWEIALRDGRRHPIFGNGRLALENYLYIM